MAMEESGRTEGNRNRVEGRDGGNSRLVDRGSESSSAQERSYRSRRENGDERNRVSGLEYYEADSADEMYEGRRGDQGGSDGRNQDTEEDEREIRRRNHGFSRLNHHRKVLFGCINNMLLFCMLTMESVFSPHESGAMALGSMGTIATSYDSEGRAMVCSLQANTQYLQCWSSSMEGSATVFLPPDSHGIAFAGLSGGYRQICALRQDTYGFLCWSWTPNPTPNSGPSPRPNPNPKIKSSYSLHYDTKSISNLHLNASPNLDPNRSPSPNPNPSSSSSHSPNPNSNPSNNLRPSPSPISRPIPASSNPNPNPNYALDHKNPNPDIDGGDHKYLLLVQQTQRLRHGSFSQVSVGSTSVCALSSEQGYPICWIPNNSTGISSSSDSSLVPLNITASQPHHHHHHHPHPAHQQPQRFSTISSGAGFVCGLATLSAASNGTDRTSHPPSQLHCWGWSSASNDTNSSILRPPNSMFRSVYAGHSHACGLTDTYNAQCWGASTINGSYIIYPPPESQFLSLALGHRHSCGIHAFTLDVICWGQASLDRLSAPKNLPFLSISAASDFTCGVLLSNLSIFCWGSPFGKGLVLPLSPSLPDLCSTSTGDCAHGMYRFKPTYAIQDRRLCAQPDQQVCTPCRIGCLSPAFTQTRQCEPDADISCTLTNVGDTSVPSPEPSPSHLTLNQAPAIDSSEIVRYRTSPLAKGFIGLAILGAFGCLCGVLALAWWLNLKLHHDHHPMMANNKDGVLTSSQGSLSNLNNKPHNNASTGVFSVMASPSLNSNAENKHRTSTSTSSLRRRTDNALNSGRGEAFSLVEMEAATMEFCNDLRIATGSFGVVYKGILRDGREVAIKRGGRELATVQAASEKRLEEKENAFQSELEFLSRLHHKHLVSLVGYCDEDDERILVYEYMPNGTLHDHLHGVKGGKEPTSGTLAWHLRIKIALEAARGVEYLHTYAVPPIIHRDIKSSNILLDGSWSARVSDFGLSIHSPSESSHVSLMAAGTLGYMDPEYYRLQHLTTKSDVYSFGVVLLELLSGERAIRKDCNGHVNIVDFAVPKIETACGVECILDKRPVAPTCNELDALEMIGHLAIMCVRLEGKERPTMSHIVDVLEKANAHLYL